MEICGGADTVETALALPLAVLAGLFEDVVLPPAGLPLFSGAPLGLVPGRLEGVVVSVLGVELAADVLPSVVA